MTITGIMPLRNAVKLGYPFELAIRSLLQLCDEVVVLVDPTSEDDTYDRVCALPVTRVVLSTWDMTNHAGHSGRSEIARQTGIALQAATGDWVLSLQADEILHESDTDTIRADAAYARRNGISGIELTRLYFYGGLDRYRRDWTVPLLRLFRRADFRPDGFSGAMQFIPAIANVQRMPSLARIFHYSRVGDAQAVALRVRNLDGFYHAPDKIAAAADVAPYDFSALRKLDTYVKGTTPEIDAGAQLVEFDPSCHPAGVRALYGY